MLGEMEASGDLKNILEAINFSFRAGPIDQPPGLERSESSSSNNSYNYESQSSSSVAKMVMNEMFCTRSLDLLKT